jgi:hypothetical protein
VFIRILHLSLSWASSIQSILPHPISLRSILILSNHLRLDLPNGLFPSGFHTNILYAFHFYPFVLHALSSSSCMTKVVYPKNQLGSLWHILTGLIFTMRNLIPHAQPSSWRTTPCRVSVTAYSVYSQLPSVSGGRLLHSHLEDAPYRDDKRPT